LNQAVRLNQIDLPTIKMKILFLAITLTLLILAGPVGPLCADAQQVPTDSQVKAAMIYNLAKFVEWPGEGVAGNTVPLTICWLGEGRLTAELQAIQGKSIRNRPVVVRHAQRPGEIGDCQILVLDESQRDQLPAILKLANWSNIFTISDMKGFAAAGGMLGFFNEGGKIRFEINLDVIEQSKVKVSSQILSLAVIVEGDNR
jgi:hypothetical protein